VAFVDKQENFSDRHCTEENPLMLQRYIEGITCSSEVLFDQGRPVAWLSSVHREFWPNRWTASCVRELVEFPGIEAQLDLIGELTQFHGLAGVDWLYVEQSRELYLIELNPRPAPCYHLGGRVGVNFAESIRQQRLGLSPTVQRPQPPVVKKALVYQFPQYCYWAIDHRLLHRILLTGSDCPWHDPVLVIALVRRIVTHYFPKSLKTKLRKLLGGRK
jgi:hypothetical protein